MSEPSRTGTTDHYGVLRVIVTEWVAAVMPPISEFARAEKALAKFKELLAKERA